MANSGLKISTSVRFWRRVDKTPGHGPKGECWLWTGCLNRGGYGRLRVLGQGEVRAHQFSFVDSGRELPKGSHKHDFCVLHSCDVRRCVNPDHLFLGTQLDNIADRDRKGRGRKPAYVYRQRHNQQETA